MTRIGSIIRECVNAAPPRFPAAIHKAEHVVIDLKDGVAQVRAGNRRVRSWIVVKF